MARLAPVFPLTAPRRGAVSRCPQAPAPRSMTDPRPISSTTREMAEPALPVQRNSGQPPARRGVSVVGMGDGAGLDPGRHTADHQLTSFAAVRAGHPGWDVVAVDAAAGGAGGRAARRAWRAGIPPSPVIPVPGRQRYATGPPPSRPGTTTSSSCPCCSSSCPSFPSWPRPSPRFPTQQVNEMLTRRVNVSLTGRDCRLR
jgi:hypothetical protein